MQALLSIKVVAFTRMLMGQTVLESAKHQGGVGITGHMQGWDLGFGEQHTYGYTSGLRPTVNLDDKN